MAINKAGLNLAPFRNQMGINNVQEAMKSSMSKWIAVLAVVASQHSWAIPITDVVVVDGQEWAQVNLFANNSWDTINGQCPAGACPAGSDINGYDLEGWTWASVDEVQALFNFFTGQSNVAPSSYDELDSTWAPLFVSLFHSTFSIDQLWDETVGFTATTANDQPDRAYLGAVYDYTYPDYSSMDNASTNSHYDKANVDGSFGAWFVRAARVEPVPAPATLPLLGLGLAALGFCRRKRGKHN